MSILLVRPYLPKLELTSLPGFVNFCLIIFYTPYGLKMALNHVNQLFKAMVEWNQAILLLIVLIASKQANLVIIVNVKDTWSGV